MHGKMVAFAYNSPSLPNHSPSVHSPTTTHQQTNAVVCGHRLQTNAGARVSFTPMFNCRSRARFSVPDAMVFSAPLRYQPVGDTIFPGIFLTSAAASKEVDQQPSVDFPDDYRDITFQIASALASAIEKGNRLLEVEFPPLPASQLEAADAYTISERNLTHIFEIVKNLQKATVIRTARIILPDYAECELITETYGKRPAEGISVGWVKEERFDPMSGTSVQSEAADIYFLLDFSCQELPVLERYVSNLNSPAIFFNLKLETLKGDLGLPFFPSKDLNKRFLTTVFCAYYLRVRSYSRTIMEAPYVVNYGGVLFRCFPGGWQVLASGGENQGPRFVTELPQRPALGRVKRIVQESLEIGDYKKDAAPKTGLGGFLSNFREGYKETTWWEDEAENEGVSTQWRD
mmetsp:Transcript_19316/g.31626  ORF Transcript_19316/g.31626 Transcript_19316/m.31626 type:complete len:403 (+) Transcript_19316:23-1231(+)|eukprot:CAMPEP_0184333370 /NCGR_PEP_ID=MMETSP1089-20130417/2361_1 /TAXON_ID=38269 ORGANISM="Gloeochaete wittrockiana, Strain SAG46.84" /NCGR_SAMPLE_ID=MMETSP1089 /ASSEMBLY_ACC=CAM_ASM_000445 /LENGTH=402 /DNA_ID=CAMNT_0026657145 /DNA_START=9 /DNA_END=1217 /DNA_ORIENTATION=+